MRYTFVQFDDVLHSNREYHDLVVHSYRTQATLTLQRAFRAKKKKKNLPVSQRKEIKVTRTDSILGVILEPCNEKYLEYAEKINRGEYLTLDFNDTDFVRHLFKALRLSKITLNQLLMAQDLFELHRWLSPEYSYVAPQAQSWQFPAGPYSPQSIEYATEAQCARFLNSLPVEDRRYFTVNFSKHAEECLTGFLLFYADHFRPGAIGHLQAKTIKRAILKKNHKGLIDSTLFLRIKAWVESDSTELGDELIEILKKIFPDYSQKTNDSLDLFAAILALNEQIPGLVLSPDYDKEDFATPLLSFVLLSNHAMNKLQEAVHGNEAVVHFPVAGQFDTRLIRYLIDDHTQLADVLSVMNSLYPFFDRGRGFSRPIEITHPSLVSNQTPHGYSVCNFLLTWHDKLHAWRSGCNFKLLFQYMRNLHSQWHKGSARVMNRTIWKLSDLDYSLGHTLISKYDYSMRERAFNYAIQSTLLGVNSHELVLITAFDMLKNKNFWLQIINQILQPRVFATLDQYGLQYATAPDRNHYKSESFEPLQLLGHLVQDNNLFKHLMEIPDSEITETQSKMLLELCKNRGFCNKDLFSRIWDLLSVYEKILPAYRYDFLLNSKREIMSLVAKGNFWYLATKLPVSHMRAIVEMYHSHPSTLSYFLSDLSVGQHKVLDKNEELHVYLSSNSLTRRFMLNLRKLCVDQETPNAPLPFSFFYSPGCAIVSSNSTVTTTPTPA